MNTKQHENDKMHELAFHLITKEKKKETEVVNTLMQYGVEEQNAKEIYLYIEKKIKEIENTPARKDMIYGALWCIGGIVFTISDVGYIFWGAIVFGGVQFLKGLTNLK